MPARASERKPGTQSSELETMPIIAPTRPENGRAQIILGIETSCDETAAAVVSRDAEGRGTILANVVRSQVTEHLPFGGVVPEIAARAHILFLDQLIAAAMSEAGLSFPDLDAVAATAGPGLIGGLIVGLTTGKAIAYACRIPLIAINHLEAHALTPGLTEGLKPPYLLLLVSGGHTQILNVEGLGRHRRLATTIDDALGEAFDKTAKILGLGYPGGPEVERRAALGDSKAYPLPRPMLGRPEPHFSFAGLKTAVRQCAERERPLTEQKIADICASFQAAVSAAVVDRVGKALIETGSRTLVIAGGVAANKVLRAALETLCTANGARLVAPPLALCTDNAAMIAWAGAEWLAAGITDPLDAPIRVRWPLDPTAAPALGAGRLGAKA